jgi:endonuclease/exonuclease/phosphatase family metal-dependent hydrolase
VLLKPPTVLITLIFLTFTMMSRASEVTVMSYNMGQLSYFGSDAVPCTQERLPLQIHALEAEILDSKTTSDAVISSIQEAWTPESYKALSDLADKLGLFINPPSYDQVQDRGMIVLSTHAFDKVRFHPFIKDVSKRGIWEHFFVVNGSQFILANTHTEFSSRVKLSSSHGLQFAKINSFLKVRENHLPLILTGDFNSGPMLAESYEVHNTLWNSILFKDLRTIKKDIRENGSITWDHTNNALVYKPSKVIEFIYEDGEGWARYPADFDHVLFSDKFSQIQSELILNDENTSLKCEGRDHSYLSDHYGVKTKLRLK